VYIIEIIYTKVQSFAVLHNTNLRAPSDLAVSRVAFQSKTAQ